jgi:hypothetical protein
LYEFSNIVAGNSRGSRSMRAHTRSRWGRPAAGWNLGGSTNRPTNRSKCRHAVHTSRSGLAQSLRRSDVYSHGAGEVGQQSRRVLQQSRGELDRACVLFIKRSRSRVIVRSACVYVNEVTRRWSALCTCPCFSRTFIVLIRLVWPHFAVKSVLFLFALCGHTLRSNQSDSVLLPFTLS